ncbi:glucan biosynthesis protein [Thalassospira sp. TSL5-1]|uniref:glucan biosynthesis protein n=1 Tax=Thalassospira sp. TSL5-1 TaxID=1544451 RepID=UPI0009FAD516|nr:glucan biosynthesis protein [Thalassospira sp. TSL5-1]
MQICQQVDSQCVPHKRFPLFRLGMASAYVLTTLCLAGQPAMAAAAKAHATTKQSATGASDAPASGQDAKASADAGKQTAPADQGDKPASDASVSSATPAAENAPAPDANNSAGEGKAAENAPTDNAPTDQDANAPATNDNQAPSGDAVQAAQGEQADQAEQAPAFSPQLVIDRARELAKKPFENPHRELPAALADLDAAKYAKIKFKSDQAFLKDPATGFSMELYHPGYMYDVPVGINTVRDGKVQPVPYSANLFDFADTGLSDNNVGAQGYAGFKLKYPLDSVTSNEELASFLGASYFRVMGRNQVRGQLARALAIDLAAPSGEEFPVFREFWIEQPTDPWGKVTVYALLDSARVTGAYQFDIVPGERSVASIKATLFFRDQIQKLGIAPLSSMFLFGEQKRRHFDDYRDEVHNSDGLLIHNGQGEWLWRPLDNPKNLQISSFLDQNPRGFGLMQRDRNFDHYQDASAHFEKRPGYWITPKGDWGKGHVELVEIPSPDETNENIVAFWVPDVKPKAGDQLEISYDLTAMSDGRELHGMARALDTRITPVTGGDEDNGGVHRFILNFRGGDLDYYLDDIANLQADISASNANVTNVHVVKDAENGGVRVLFDLAGTGEAPTSNLRAFLHYKDRVISETWTMPWAF